MTPLPAIELLPNETTPPDWSGLDPLVIARRRGKVKRYVGVNPHGRISNAFAVRRPGLQGGSTGSGFGCRAGELSGPQRRSRHEALWIQPPASPSGCAPLVALRFLGPPDLNLPFDTHTNYVRYRTEALTNASIGIISTASLGTLESQPQRKLQLARSIGIGCPQEVGRCLIVGRVEARANLPSSEVELRSVAHNAVICDLKPPVQVIE